MRPAATASVSALHGVGSNDMTLPAGDAVTASTSCRGRPTDQGAEYRPRNDAGKGQGRDSGRRVPAGSVAARPARADDCGSAAPSADATAVSARAAPYAPRRLPGPRLPTVAAGHL